MSMQDIKAGDEVIMYLETGAQQLCFVSRLTAKYMVIGDTKFSRRTGQRAGDRGPWRTVFVEEATPKRILSYTKWKAEQQWNMRQYKARRSLGAIKITKDNIERIETFLKEANGTNTRAQSKEQSNGDF